MRLDTVRVGRQGIPSAEPVALRLGRAVTLLSGSDLAAATALLRVVARAIDDRMPVEGDPAPVGHEPTDDTAVVVLGWDDRAHGRHERREVEVSWPGGERMVTVHGGNPLDVHPGCLVACWTTDGPAAVIARLADVLATEQVDSLAADLLPTVRRILPEVDRLDLPDGLGGPVRAVDVAGEQVPDDRLRAAVAAALAAHLVRVGTDIAAVVMETPERDLPDTSLGSLRDELLEVAVAADAPVVCVTGSAALVAADPDVSVVRVTRTPDGRTTVGSPVHGDDPAAARVCGDPRA